MQSSIAGPTQTPPSVAWLNIFLAAISQPRITIPADFIQRFSETLQGRRIYIENLRSLLGVSAPVARALLSIAWSRDLLTHNVLLLCPNPDCGRALIELSFVDAASALFERTICCEVCEAMEREMFEFPAAACQRLDVYHVQETARGALV